MKLGGKIKLKKREQLKNLFKLGKIWMGVWVVKLFEWRGRYGKKKRHVKSFKKGRVQKEQNWGLRGFGRQNIRLRGTMM